VDHIYPQSILRNTFGLPVSEVNHMGNYRLVGATDNLRKRAEPPATYFGRLKNSGVEIRRHLLVDEYAKYPSQMTLDVPTYRQFRDLRCATIFQIANRIVNPELMSEDSVV